MKALYLIFSRLRYFAPSWVFASLNIVIGTWVLYIPYVKDKIGIDNGELGLALFFLALGTLVMIPLSPKIIGKWGVGKTTLFGIIMFSFLFVFPLLMSSFTGLCIALFASGMGACLTDIAMNALVSEIEQEDNVHFMSASHGFFSLGGALGAGIGTFLLGYFKIPFYHMIAIAVVVIIINILISPAYFKIRGKIVDRKETSLNLKIFKPLIALTLIAFIIMGGEGAIEHWSKLYLQDVVKVSSGQVSGIGFIVFSITMTIGRFFGDAISKKYGSFSIIIGGCLVSIIGFLAVLSAQLSLTIVGFGFVGLGFSVIIPELFRLAGKTKGISPAEGISFVAGFGYLGFLISPAFLGFLSEIGTLKLSFMALLIATSIVVLIAIVKKRTL